MSKVVVSASISLDGFVAGPNDGGGYPLGQRGGELLFKWMMSGARPDERTVFAPEGGSAEVVREMFAQSGCMLTGKRTYEIAHGWGGSHPVNGMPVVIVTRSPDPRPPQGRSRLEFVTTGVVDAVARAKELAAGKDVGIGGASVARQALDLNLVDEVYLHIAPIILGAGVSLFHGLSREVKLDPLGIKQGPWANHLHYRVRR